MSDIDSVNFVSLGCFSKAVIELFPRNRDSLSILAEIDLSESTGRYTYWPICTVRSFLPSLFGESLCFVFDFGYLTISLDIVASVGDPYG